MALITGLPAKEIVDSLHGVLDFSVWCDKTIVRKWPRAPSGPRSAPSTRTANQFSNLNSMLRGLSAEIIESYQTLATGTSFTWKDFATRNYIDGTKDLQEYLIGTP